MHMMMDVGSSLSASPSPETAELAEELLKEKPDRNLVAWLVEDGAADVISAMHLAKLQEEDMMKKPQLRALTCLHKHLRRQKNRS